MRTFICVVVAVLALGSSTLARILDRCSLAKELEGLSVPRDQLARWTCIAEQESNYRTDAVGRVNPDGSRNYGLFHLSDRYWCQPATGQSSNACNVNCNDLIVDDITNSVRCAQRVQSQQGWNAWATWTTCSGDLPSIDPCFA